MINRLKALFSQIRYRFKRIIQCETIIEDLQLEIDELKQNSREYRKSVSERGLCIDIHQREIRRLEAALSRITKMPLGGNPFEAAQQCRLIAHTALSGLEGKDD